MVVPTEPTADPERIESSVGCCCCSREEAKEKAVVSVVVVVAVVSSARVRSIVSDK